MFSLSSIAGAGLFRYNFGSRRGLLVGSVRAIVHAVLHFNSTTMAFVLFDQERDCCVMSNPRMKPEYLL